MVSVSRAHAKAWCRVDFAGGTLDIWPLGLLHRNACTVNVALDLPVEVEIARRESGYQIRQGGRTINAAGIAELRVNPETSLVGLIGEHIGLPPASISVASSSPRGGGLGASSALTVAMIAAAEALTGNGESVPSDRAATARDLEAQLMSLPTGGQDHFPALLGGAHKIGLRPGGQLVRRIETDLEALAESLVVAFTGQSHFSAGSNWEVIRRRLDGHRETIARFDGIAETAYRMAEALETSDFERVGGLMSREWDYRRGLAPGVSTDRIEALLDAAAESGSWGGKVCGAGGGGCLAVLAPRERRRQVESALKSNGADVLSTGPAAGPMIVTTA